MLQLKLLKGSTDFVPLQKDLALVKAGPEHKQEKLCYFQTMIKTRFESAATNYH